MPKIIIEGRVAEPEERIRSAIQLQKLAEAAGWKTAIGYSQFQDDDRTFKTGAKAGTTVEGKIVDNVWLQGIRKGHVFSATWHDGKLNNVLVDRTISTLADLKLKFKEEIK